MERPVSADPERGRVPSPGAGAGMRGGFADRRAAPLPSSGELRDPALVMGASRLAAAYPDAMSFCRSAMREIVRGRWTIDKLRFDLDAEGRGEILYRLTGAGREFHFFLISNKLPEASKTDRNFAASWDAMGVLCEGHWTPQREARLRREVPRQRAGMADYDTLVYARGNRSGRLFDYVVDCLADGRQPDPAQLASVGYILRTTAFIGNGQCGTRPLDGFGPGHPLGRPYHAQFCSAFMLREYVFDLVDHMARARSARALRLAPAIRRYLGVGNSAATGLVHYAANHPQQLHQWTLAREIAMARIRVGPVSPDDATVQRCLALLDRACRYVEQGMRAPDGVFCDLRVLVSDLRLIAGALEAYRAGGDGGDDARPSRWADLLARVGGGVGPEAIEVLHAVLLEAHPDIAEAASRDTWADERFTLDPAMTASELRAVLDTRYGWALAPDDTGERDGCFWYRASDAPRDSRRGIRGCVPQFEAETMIDTPLLVRRLREALERAPVSQRVADLVRERPELRQVVARVQTLADLPYAEPRVDWLSPRYEPYGTIRFVLALFGLEKFEAAAPKSVRGTFMQGAPIAEDVARGLDGDWPFPLVPEIDPAARAAGGDARSDTALAPLPQPGAARPAYTANDGEQAAAVQAGSPASIDAAPVVAIDVAPGELERMVRTALHGGGMSLGEAADAAEALVFAQARGLAALEAVLIEVSAGTLPRRAIGQPVLTDDAIEFEAGASPAFAVAAVARDASEAGAAASPPGVALVHVNGARDASLIVESVLRIARRGRIALLVWRGARADPAGLRAGLVAAGPAADGAWYVEWPVGGESSLADPLLALSALGARLGTGRLAEHVRAAARAWSARASAPDTSAGAGRFLLLCADAQADESLRGLAALREAAGTHAGEQLVWDAAELRRRQQAWRRGGIPVQPSTYVALERAGAALLVPADAQHRILPPDTDPLKVF